METSERQTRSHLMQLFRRHGFRPRFELGQNFLIDLNIIEFVVRSAELTRNDVVLEVGTGTGGMTTFLASEAGHVISVDIDRQVHLLAREATAAYDNVTLLNQDALQSKHRFAPEVLENIKRQLAISPDRQLKLVANLPYGIATPVIANLVATDLPWNRMVVTIQYEVALRMQAEPRSEAYGALSVWLQSQCHVEILKKLGPTVFWPRPKVDSAVVLLTPDPEKRQAIGDREFFHDYLRGAFNHRRKLFRSVLHGLYPALSKPEIDDLLHGRGLVESVRAEELDVVTHVALAAGLRKRLAEKQELMRRGAEAACDSVES